MINDYFVPHTVFLYLSHNMFWFIQIYKFKLFDLFWHYWKTIIEQIFNLQNLVIERRPTLKIDANENNTIPFNLVEEAEANIHSLNEATRKNLCILFVQT